MKYTYISNWCGTSDMVSICWKSNLLELKERELAKIRVLGVFFSYSFSEEIAWTYTGKFKFICRVKSHAKAIQSVAESDKKDREQLTQRVDGNLDTL